ncbi:MAG: hypothetical protein ACXADW_22020, partial [Candidatus Hodarchaeales archaeon]|jgi:hypothetical protein
LSYILQAWLSFGFGVFIADFLFHFNKRMKATRKKNMVYITCEVFFKPFSLVILWPIWLTNTILERTQ